MSEVGASTAPARSPRILFAGGGSGGHLAPAIAVAEQVQARHPEAKVGMLCSQRPIDAAMLSAAGIPFEALPAAPWGRNPRAWATSLAAQWRALQAARAHLARERPDTVVAVGGYASVPGAMAARRAGVPLLLFNLDARPGLANRLVARIAEQVVSAVPVPDRRGFAHRVVGPPLRRASLAPDDAAGCRSALGFRPERPVLLVTGASQGARTLNDLMPHWCRLEPETFAGWQVLHLSGGDPTALRQAYAAAGVDAVVEPFLDRIGLAWGAASLALSRAGANSVAEAHANAVPTVFAPYPHHRDRHQAVNAAALAAIGGAVVADDLSQPQRNMGTLAAAVRLLLLDPARRRRMVERLRADPPCNGAAAVAEMLVPTATAGPTA